MRYIRYWLTGFILIIFLFLLHTDTFALPAHKRLFKRKYGYKVSCNLCHSQGGGSAINLFGKEFKRSGLSFNAFSKIETRDSDKDGIKNIDEINARANPGDARSTPKNPGDWLRDIEASFIPREQLVELFPHASYFTVLEGSLKKNQISQIESRVGRSLSDEEKVPTFYFAFSGTREDPMRIGLSLFLSPQGKKGSMMVGVGMDLKGKITKAIIYRSKEDKRIFNEAFLSQFIGKSLKDSFRVSNDVIPVKGEEEISQYVATAIHIGLLTTYQVFARRQK